MPRASSTPKDRPLQFRRRVVEYERTYGPVYLTDASGAQVIDEASGEPIPRIDVETGQPAIVELDAVPKRTELHLDGDAWPPRHEFGWDWLATTPEAVYDPAGRTITITVGNGSARYQVVDSIVVEATKHGPAEERRSAAGVWAELVEGHVDQPEPTTEEAG